MEHCCKVGRLIADYDLQDGVAGADLEEYLLMRWLGRDDYSATGLRPLKDWFNQKLMKQVYSDHDRNALESRVQSDYEALNDESEAFAVIDDLVADGIDGNQLQSDFISTATLYRHFTECLAESKSTEPSQQNWEKDKVEYARDIVVTNVEQSLQSLENKDRLAAASEAEVTTEIVLSCPKCPVQVSFERAVQRGYICETHMGAESSQTGAPDTATTESPIDE